MHVGRNRTEIGSAEIGNPLSHANRQKMKKRICDILIMNILLLHDKDLVHVHGSA